MSSVTITIHDLLSIAEALWDKGYNNDDFTIKLIDTGPEITIRDANDMLITNWKKPTVEKSDKSIFSPKNRFR